MSLPALGLIAQGVIILFSIAAVAIFIIAFFCFDDTDPDIFWHDSFTETERPYVALKADCKHEGEKTLVVVSSPMNCEVVHTVCDDCSQTLNVDIDCR